MRDAVAIHWRTVLVAVLLALPTMLIWSIGHAVIWAEKCTHPSFEGVEGPEVCDQPTYGLALALWSALCLAGWSALVRKQYRRDNVVRARLHADQRR